MSSNDRPARSISADNNRTARSWRKFASSALVVLLTFTLTPGMTSWANEPSLNEPADSSSPQTSQDITSNDDSPSLTPLAIDDPDPALPNLALDVRIKSDGTPNWDADDTAGNDSDANNGIVRVNDTVTYEVEYAVPSSTAENTTFSLTFPQGMEITELPGYCAAGSSITPETAGEPSLPLSANSIDELVEQTLICNRGTITSGTDIVDVTVKVLNLAHQGQDLQLQAAQLTADNHNGIALSGTALPNVKASARLKWDISKNGTSLTENSGYAYGPANVPCPGDNARTCKLTSYSVLFSAPAGGKGAMPAIGDITFVDDLTPEAMYPSLDPASIAAINADPQKYGSFIQVGSSSHYAQPGNAIGGTYGGTAMTAANSVRDSGTITVDQVGPGQPATITISEPDMSLRTYPQRALRPQGMALPSSAAYAISSQLHVYTPIDTIRDFGTANNAGTAWTLPTFNSYSQLDIRGFDANNDQQTSTDQPGDDATGLPTGVNGPIHWNDYRQTFPNVQLSGGFSKRFAGVPGTPGNMSPVAFGPSDSSWGEGPPGGATVLSGGITAAPTQQVTSQLTFVGSNTAMPMPVSFIGCDSWDNTRLYLQEVDSTPVGSGGSGYKQRIPSEGKAVWLSGYNNVPGTHYATSADQGPDLKIQYSALPGVSNSANPCADEHGPWYDSPLDVPGNDPALITQGTYTAVGRVRVFLALPAPVANTATLGAGVSATVSIGMKVADTAMATGTILPNFMGGKMVRNAMLSPDDMIAHPQPWSTGSYNPASHTGGYGDRLILAHAQARIDKQVRKGDSGSFSHTPPATTGGDSVQYRLQASLTSGATTSGVLKDVWIEDCLPPSQIYSSASRTPTLVVSAVTAATMPADAKRPACTTGETYIRWVIEDHEVNQAIEPIVITADVNPDSDDGVSTNTVVVWAEDDASTLAQRSASAQIQISNIRGVRITKRPLTPVVQVNRHGQVNNELNEWSVRFSNRLPGNAPVPDDPDIIDVLPKQGLIGSNFHGSFTLHSVDITEGNLNGQPVRVLYTKDTNPAEDPRDTRNGVNGDITWCNAPSSGGVVSGNGAAADCPQTLAEVTAVRVQRPGPFSTGSAIQFTIRMVGVDNRGGDVYVNRAMGFATGLENAVRSAESPEVVIASSLGDYAWWDFNRNGIQDHWQGSAEQPASNIRVKVTGRDDLGNLVNATTTTDANGSYTFSRLRSSNPAGYTVTFTRPDGTSFTVKAAGSDSSANSNATPSSGAADPVMLGRDAHVTSIDAGLLPEGAVQINKLLKGGATSLAVGDTLTFQVVCVFDPQLSGVNPYEVLNRQVSIPVSDAHAITSDILGPLPAYTSCTITETDAASADHTAAPVTVTVPWDTSAQKAGTAIASLTNFYSAGTLEVTKEIVGDKVAVEAAKDQVFELLVSCQIPEEDNAGNRIITDVYSGVVKIKGGQTKYLVDDNDNPRALPIGTRCFGDEVNTGGAKTAVVEFDSWKNAAVVTKGSAEDLQTLTINAVNTFEDAALTVSKKVRGLATGEDYRFTLTCTIPGTDTTGKYGNIRYEVSEADARFTLADGDSRTITLPASATCQVRETNIPAGAKATIIDSDDSTQGGTSDGIVSELTGTRNTVEVTNTFGTPTGTAPASAVNASTGNQPGTSANGSPNPANESSLAVTGAEFAGGAGLIGVGLLLIGTAFLLIHRRSRGGHTPVSVNRNQ